jgi:hypothetical protein
LRADQGFSLNDIFIDEFLTKNGTRQVSPPPPRRPLSRPAKKPPKERKPGEVLSPEWKAKLEEAVKGLEKMKEGLEKAVGNKTK